MHFNELARSISHFKETAKGRNIMCEKVQRYAKQYALDSKIQDIKNLMKNMNLPLDQLLDGLNLSPKERKYILNKIQNDSTPLTKT